jgi:hypothetical protein
MCSCPEDCQIVRAGKQICQRCVANKEVRHTESLLLDEILSIRDRWCGALQNKDNSKKMREELGAVQKRFAGLRVRFSVEGDKVTIECDGPPKN